MASSFTPWALSSVVCRIWNEGFRQPGLSYNSPCSWGGLCASEFIASPCWMLGLQACITMLSRNFPKLKHFGFMCLCGNFISYSKSKNQKVSNLSVGEDRHHVTPASLLARCCVTYSPDGTLNMNKRWQSGTNCAARTLWSTLLDGDQLRKIATVVCDTQVAKNRSSWGSQAQLTSVPPGLIAAINTKPNSEFKLFSQKLGFSHWISS